MYKQTKSALKKVAPVFPALDKLLSEKAKVYSPKRDVPESKAGDVDGEENNERPISAPGLIIKEAIKGQSKSVSGGRERDLSPSPSPPTMKLIRPKLTPGVTNTGMHNQRPRCLLQDDIEREREMFLGSYILNICYSDSDNQHPVTVEVPRRRSSLSPVSSDARGMKEARESIVYGNHPDAVSFACFFFLFIHSPCTAANSFIVIFTSTRYRLLCSTKLGASSLS